MKKIALFIGVICALLPSCNKENNTATIVATTESCTREKTYLENHIDNNGNEYFEIKWEVGDGIYFLGIAADGGLSGCDFLTVDGVSTDGRTAYIHFDGSPGGDYNHQSVFGASFIGYDAEYDYESGCITNMSEAMPIVSIPTTQRYDETRTVRDFPMFCDFSDEWEEWYGGRRQSLHMSFHNICGLLRIRIKDGRDNLTHIKKVKIMSGNGISGNCSYNVNSNTTHSVYGHNFAHDVYVSSSNNYVKLICSDANEGTGVPLAIDGTDFYFYIIPTLMNDMIIEVTNMNDEVATKNLSGHEIQIMRSQLTGIKVDFTNVPFN